MKKKFIAIVIMVATILSCMFALTACGSVNNQASDQATTSWYYLYESNETDKSTYIVLNEDEKEWRDNVGLSGTYQLAEGNITFYLGGIHENSGTVLVSGTLSGNNLVLTWQSGEVSYHKEAVDPEDSGPNNAVFFVVLIVLIGLLVVWFFFSGRKNKQRQQEYVEQLAAIAPGHKVKTVGGICGVVVEVCDDNTVIVETGTEASGRSYVKMDKEYIGQTDAKGATQIAREEAEAKRKAEKEAKSESFPAEEKPEEKEEAPEEKGG